MLNEEIKEKHNKNILDKYNGIGFSSEKINNKIQKTIKNKYDVDNVMLNEDIRKKYFIISQDKNYIKYLNGKVSLFKCDCGKNHFFKIDTDNYFKRKERKNKICTICYPICENASLKEKMLYNFIKENYNGKIIQNYRDKKEIDIYLPELGVGFEFNGIYWHSNGYVENNYHINKLEYFKSKNIRIFYVWEDDWDYKNDIIKSQILNWKISSEFLDKNHIQGKVRSSLKLGLYFKEKLVSIMTFDNFEGRKKMENNSWNLSRFCSLINTNVVGGASKLLNYFVKKYNPKKIITYADYEWSDGLLYKKLGFEYSLIKNSYNCIGFSVGCILFCLFFIFCCNKPHQRQENFRTAVLNEVQASSQSA